MDEVILVENLIPENIHSTHILIVLDESGSMGRMQGEAIDGFNEQISELKGKQTDKHSVYVSFTKFGSKPSIEYVAKPVNEVELLTTETYKPGGMTALYDAVGETIQMVEDAIGEPENSAFLVMVISDGQENNSKNFTSKSLSEVVKRRQEKNWTFTYMGSNQDLSVISESLGIDKRNFCSFTATKDGTNAAFNAYKTGMGKFMNYRMDYAGGAQGPIGPQGAQGCSMSDFFTDEDAIVSAENVK